MPETAEEYRKRAEEARRQAGNARNPEERAAFNEIAELWLRLAADRAARPS